MRAFCGPIIFIRAFYGPNNSVAGCGPGLLHIAGRGQKFRPANNSDSAYPTNGQTNNQTNKQTIILIFNLGSFGMLPCAS